MANEINALLRLLRKRGYDPRNENGHYYIYKNGVQVRRKSGQPLTFPSSPSDSQFGKHARKELKRLGII